MPVRGRELSKSAGMASLGSKKQKIEGKQYLKIASWNVNGIRACSKKEQGFESFVRKESPDVLCLSEIKCLEEKNPSLLEDLGYSIYWNAAKVKKGGYSGTAYLLYTFIL